MHNRPMAMVRTVFSPRCWATSRTRRDWVPWTSRALRMEGRLSVSNCAAQIRATLRGSKGTDLDIDDGPDDGLDLPELFRFRGVSAL
jgi:hypothetical protein